MTTTEKTITELLADLHQTMTDKALGDVIGVSSKTVYRWRHETSPVSQPKLVRAALEELLERNNG